MTVGLARYPAAALASAPMRQKKTQAVQERPRVAAPQSCLRHLYLPGRYECAREDCCGFQEDGTCLADIVRSARAQGVEPTFEIRPSPNWLHDRQEGAWVYDGPPVEILPPEPEAVAEMPPPPSFVCPHCGEENAQDWANLHYWCGFCGKNAKDVD